MLLKTGVTRVVSPSKGETTKFGLPEGAITNRGECFALARCPHDARLDIQLQGGETAGLDPLDGNGAHDGVVGAQLRRGDM